MYSTKLVKQRYEIECISLARVIKIQRFIVDTGAMYSCCHYSMIDEKLQESELFNLNTKLIGGFVNGLAVKFYEYPLKQFTVGNINQGPCSIWITFDERVADMVLGLDILKNIIFLNRPNDKEMYFFESDVDCKEYMQTI
ncbi:MAG: retropepsin-like domain-containing protein [Lachnospiraceae bacterium]|nr:retropepsin-like domain-containing protein [Lachnospiraceae bacterium]